MIGITEGANSYDVHHPLVKQQVVPFCPPKKCIKGWIGKYRNSGLRVSESRRIVGG